jgi:hypothetical protein
MNLKVANDVPKELIEILKKCDFSSIPESQHDAKLTQLSNFASQWIPRKSDNDIINNTHTEINLNKCPRKLINLINQMDFNKINSIKRAVAMPYIKKYLKDNKLMK